ncbi:MAG: hypothetical protein AB7G13_01920 [Lautropia sp.]
MASPPSAPLPARPAPAEPGGGDATATTRPMPGGAAARDAAAVNGAAPAAGAPDARAPDSGTATSALDPRAVFATTEAGEQAIKSRSRRVSLGAHRLLMMLDGQRSLEQLPSIVRPGDMPTLLRELEAHGMITLAGILSDDSAPLVLHPDTQLARIKQALAGVFHQELGPDALVLEARVQDCVNLFVLRNVLREVIGLVARRKDLAAADRIALIVKRHEPF